MRFSFASLIVLALPAFAAPTVLKTVEKAGKKVDGSYIVTLNKDVSKAKFLADLTERLGPDEAITHDWNPDFINGFAAKLSPTLLDFVRALAGVSTISEDSIVTTSEVNTQRNAPWGLQRISQREKLGSQDTNALTYTYTYEAKATGSGVDVYVIDTGINIEHLDFKGRASWGITIGDYGNVDGNGHGTHVAGTVGGSQFGVAKAVNLIAVKVLSNEGSGPVSGIISGLNWVQEQVASSGRPSIATMSLGGTASTPLDDAVAALTNANIHVTVAAGNDGLDAGNTSPARAPSAITVGAMEINDKIAPYSNYGRVVDIFAPGTDIISTWIGSNTATNQISGTSMATPHVAGLIACIISRDGNLLPAEMQNKVKATATQGKLSGLPLGGLVTLPLPGTPPFTVNKLAYIGA